MLMLQLCVYSNHAQLVFAIMPRSVGYQGNKGMNWIKKKYKEPNKKKRDTHTKGCCCVLDSVSSTPLVTITVVQCSTGGHFLLFVLISLTVCIAIPPRVHCLAGSYRCPPSAPVSHHMCLYWGIKHGDTERFLPLMFFMLCANPRIHTSTKSLIHSLPAGRRWECSGGAPLSVGKVFLWKDGWGRPHVTRSNSMGGEKREGWNPGWSIFAKGLYIERDTEDMGGFRQLKWKWNLWSCFKSKWTFFKIILTFVNDSGTKYPAWLWVAVMCSRCTSFVQIGMVNEKICNIVH